MLSFLPRPGTVRISYWYERILKYYQVLSTQCSVVLVLVSRFAVLGLLYTVLQRPQKLRKTCPEACTLVKLAHCTLPAGIIGYGTYDTIFSLQWCLLLILEVRTYLVPGTSCGWPSLNKMVDTAVVYRCSPRTS